MKREYTASTSPSPAQPGSPVENNNKPSTPTTKQRKMPKSSPAGAAATATPTASPRGGDGAAKPSASGLTPDMREALISKIIALGLKACKLDELAAEFGITKIQLNNAMQQGKPGNLRGRVIKAARGG